MLHYAMSNDLSIIMFDFYLGLPHIMKIERSKKSGDLKTKKASKKQQNPKYVTD